MTTLPLPVRVISSMATRSVLADLVASFEQTSSIRISVESTGGVDAAKRIEAREPFDVVVLAAEVITRLAGAHCVVASSRRDLVASGIAVAVRAGDTPVDIGSEEALRHAVLNARSMGYSTGPSGAHLMNLFARWGILEGIRNRLVQAPPGVPVGELLGSGKVDLGFQQLSELMHVKEIVVLGPLPEAIQSTTIFSAARTTWSQQIAEADRFIEFIASDAADEAKQRNGMMPV
ncbi:substrate-binding domain-containing protein [Paraburkholderia sp.]|uniref:substrate-binding domain-containing protein n=1 Tax=Paraburkholderia sp. TaxID=1926495 RepID=UPI003D6F01D1